MNDKVFCPWCGNEMVRLMESRYNKTMGAKEHHGCYACQMCGATAPESEYCTTRKAAEASALAAAQKRPASYRQLSNLLCGKENATPNEMIEAAKQVRVKPRKPISLADIKWLGVPYFAEYKGLDKLFCYVTGSGISADFAAAREMGWTGKVLKDLWDWEDEHGKLKVRLWECHDCPPTDAERAAAPWEEPRAGR